MPPVDQRYFKKADESIDQYNTRVSGFQTINSAALSPQKPFVPAVAEESPIPDVSSLNADVSDLFAPTKQEQDFTSSRSRISDLTQQLSGIAPRRAELEVQEDVAGKKRLVQDLSSQLASLQAEAKTIPLQIQQQFEGQGATRGGIAPHETARLRENAIKTLPIAAQLEAARGNLSLAIDLVDRAVNTEFAPIQAKLDAEMKNLDLILKDPAATREQQERAEARRTQAIAQKEAADNAKEEKRSIQNLAVQLSGFGVDTAITRKVQNATSFDEALLIASPYMQDPSAKYKLESLRLDNILAKENIRTEQLRRSKLVEEIETEKAQRQKLSELSPAEKKELEKEAQAKIATAKTAKAQIPVLQEKIDLAEELKTHRGLSGTVGPYALSRFTPFKVDAADKQDFAAKVHRLTAGLTLDSLISAKERGATFGALSEGELRALSNAASTLNDWEIKDDSGNPTGKWLVDEASFTKELDRIKRFTEIDKARRTGEVFSDDERSILDAVFVDSDTNFDPANYF